MSQEHDQLSVGEKKKEDWMNAKWRPMMGWMYMVVCTMDFVLFPILWSGLQAVMKVAQITQWNPLTLQGAGLFHIAMGAVLGVAAFGRTQEKLAGANNGGATAMPAAGGFAPPSTGFGSAPTGFSSTTPAAPFSFDAGQPGFGATPAAQVVSGFGGKPAPLQPPQPVL